MPTSQPHNLQILSGTESKQNKPKTRSCSKQCKTLNKTHMHMHMHMDSHESNNKIFRGKILENTFEMFNSLGGNRSRRRMHAAYLHANLRNTRQKNDTILPTQKLYLLLQYEKKKKGLRKEEYLSKIKISIANAQEADVIVHL